MSNHKILKSTDQNYVEIDLQLEAETAAACLLSDGTTKAWVPKSQMEDEPEHLGSGLVRIIIPEWLAQKKRVYLTKGYNMPFQKQPPIKAPKLTKATEGQPCYLRVPGICNGDIGTTVPCHSPFREDNQGVAQKAHDFLTVPGCMACHDWLDSRTHREVPIEDKWEVFHLALKKWWEHLWREGVIGLRRAA